MQVSIVGCKSVEIYSLLSWNKNMDVSWADNSVKNWRNLPISNLKPDLHNSNVHTVWWKSIDSYSIYHPETWMQAANSWWNLPISNPKPDLYFINAHTMFGDNLLIFTQIITWKWKSDKSWADKSVRNWQNLPISNPKPDLHNIYAPTKFGENTLIFTQIITQIRKYKWMYDSMTDRWQTDWHMDYQRETVIPRH